MSDDTLPPRQPNTPRVLLKRLWALAQAHPDKAIAGLLILSAFILGRCTA